MFKKLLRCLLFPIAISKVKKPFIAFTFIDSSVSFLLDNSRLSSSRLRVTCDI